MSTLSKGVGTSMTEFNVLKKYSKISSLHDSSAVRPTNFLHENYNNRKCAEHMEKRRRRREVCTHSEFKFPCEARQTFNLYQFYIQAHNIIQPFKYIIELTVNCMAKKSSISFRFTRAPILQKFLFTWMCLNRLTAHFSIYINSEWILFSLRLQIELFHHLPTHTASSPHPATIYSFTSIYGVFCTLFAWIWH